MGLSIRVAVDRISRCTTLADAKREYEYSCNLGCTSGKCLFRNCATCPVEQAYLYQKEGLMKYGNGRKTISE